ncbi:hypothetical protein HK414_20825 [Ramlibacter terrae]|uniref:NnrS family protein n=1 Tax=Ramlibacter terrae TaxID=2732511 RepID=A0ABX6P8T2_9BURK|nr:hypothetical protein HK414_20825 [Ramlibacter terrae]
MLLVLLLAGALLAGLLGGLLRLGVGPAAPADWLGRGALHHAALMICAFMGSVIGVERAVAAKRRAAWSAPFASAPAGPALLLGSPVAGAWLLVVAALVFVAVNVAVVRRQNAPHTLALLAGACAWLAGNLLYALGRDSGAVLPWWFAFPVLTIAAERLEMTRLMRRRPGTRASLYLLLAALVLGAAASAGWPRAGGAVYGIALLLLALWLLVFDIARRTVAAGGLARYMAVCLLGGYAWLVVAGIAWAATALGLPARDAALHALGLGFIVSMMMGHAPVILPAVARIKLLFGPRFYLPLAALHLSLLVRLVFGVADLGWRAHGGLANALAIALFAATVAGAALAWRHRYPS